VGRRLPTNTNLESGFNQHANLDQNERAAELIEHVVIPAVNAEIRKRQHLRDDMSWLYDELLSAGQLKIVKLLDRDGPYILKAVERKLGKVAQAEINRRYRTRKITDKQSAVAANREDKFGEMQVRLSIEDVCEDDLDRAIVARRIEFRGEEMQETAAALGVCPKTISRRLQAIHERYNDD
jgi:hypothetical protein